MVTPARTAGDSAMGDSAPGLSATLTAIEGLEKLIGSGHLRQGDRLPPERDLARQLGCSRPTIRAALQALALLGAIESRQGSGNYIRQLDEDVLGQSLHWWMRLTPVTDEVVAVLEVREVIESGLARLAATKITDEALALLDELLSELRGAESPQEVLRIDLAMHDLVAEQSENRILATILRSIREMNAAARFRTIAAPGVKDDVATDQAAVVAALKERDPEAAAQAMWNHIGRILDAYRADDHGPHPEPPTS